MKSLFRRSDGPVLQENQNYYRVLNRKMVTLMIVVSLLPLIVVSTIVGYQFHASYQEKIHAHLEELIQKHTQNIDNFLHEKLNDIRVLANSYGLAELTDEAFFQHLLTVLQKEHGGVFVDMGIVHQSGRQVAYAGVFRLEGADYSNAEWFKVAMEAQYYISDVFLGLRGFPHFIVAVKRVWQGEVYIVRATIDFVAFNSLVEHIQIGRTGSAFIMNREGKFQTRPKTGVKVSNETFAAQIARMSSRSAVSQGQTKAPILVRHDAPPLALRSRATIQNAVNISEIMDEENRKQICVMTPLKDGEWILFFLQEKADAFSQYYRTLNVALILLLIGAIGIVVTAFAVSRLLVSRIARADAEKKVMNQQIIETGKLASLGELAAGIAHEINNPVAIMVEEAGWIGDLLEGESFKDPDNYAECQRALKQIQTQGGRCKQITHKLLSFARKTDPSAVDVELNDLVREVVSLSEQRAKYSNVQMETDLAPDLPPIRLSPSEMQQVLLNLINNAIDAMGKEGGRLSVADWMEDGYLVIEVSDTGPGIPEANLPRIFDPFFTTKPVGEGTGLGLSICYGIIKKMNGEFRVKSAIGQGTTFQIWIPLAGQKSRPGAQDETESKKEIQL